MNNKSNLSKKKEAIPTLARLRMSQAENLMWKEYGQLIKRKASRAELNTWARKNKVKLKGKRVHFSRKYMAPIRVQAAPAKCEEICEVTEFETSVSIARNKVTISCELGNCLYREDTQKWYCVYECWASFAVQ